MVLFRIIVHNIEEQKLGPLLAALPFGLQPEIQRLKDKELPALPPPEKHKRHHTDKGLVQILTEFVTKHRKFNTDEVRMLFVQHGFKASSVSGTINRLLNKKLIKRINESQYELRTKPKAGYKSSRKHKPNVRKPATKANGIDVVQILAALPKTFSSAEMASVLPKFGRKPSSRNYFTEIARERGLVSMNGTGKDTRWQQTQVTQPAEQ